MVFLVTIGLMFSGFAFGQTPAPATEVLLTVNGDVASPLKLNAADFAKLPRRSVKATEHDGKTATFEGVAIVEVLKLAGLEFGEKLRGKKLAAYLLVEATDGYRVVFALPELDPAYTDKVVLLADRRDGQPLSEKEGKLRVVVPDEKRQGRWARQVITLTIRNL
jgi:hypothetical protein